MFASLRGILEPHRTAAVEAAIKRMQLSDWADRLTRDYSGGNKRKLSVALALIGDPPLLLLDEPTSGMDPHAQQFLWTAIRKVIGFALLLPSLHFCVSVCKERARSP